MRRGFTARRAAIHLAVMAGAMAIAAAAAAQSTDTVVSLFDWQGAAGPATGFFSDVAIDGSERVHAGYVYDTMSQTLDATLFSTSSAPGAASLAEHDLGFTLDPSVAVSIASQGAGRYWIAVSQSDGVTATTAHALDWKDGGPIVQTQRVGPPPGYATDVLVHGVNRLGTLVGRLGGTSAVVSPDGGDSWLPAGGVASEVFSVSPQGDVLGGTADFGGGTSVATIWDQSGTVVYQDTVAGRIRAIAPPFAVGERAGVATWWRLLGGTWQVFELSEGAVPLAGELVALDRDGFGIAGGGRSGGGAIVVNLRTSEVIDLDDALSLTPGTLWSVHGIDADQGTGIAAFAVEATDFSGWDVTASFTTSPEPVPGPGFWTIGALIATGLGVLRTSTRRPSIRARHSGFTRRERAKYFP